MGALQGSTFDTTNLLQYFDASNSGSYTSGDTTWYDARVAPGPYGVRITASVPSTAYFDNTTGRGFKLNGTSETIGFNNTTAGYSTIAAEMWISYYGTTAGTIWQATYNASTMGAGIYFAMSANRSVQLGIYTGGGGTSGTNTTKLGLGTWHHIVITASTGSNVIMYMDGEVIWTTNWTLFTASPSNSTDAHRFGGDPSITGYAPIKVGYYKLQYGVVPTAAEVRQRYNATKGRYIDRQREVIAAGSTGYGIIDYFNDYSAAPVLKTTDSGLTYSTLNAHTTSAYGNSSSYNKFFATYGAGSQIYDSTLSSSVSDTTSGMRMMSTDRGTIISRPFGGTLRRSTDGGSTWTQVASGVGSYFSNGLHYGNGVCFFSATDTNAISTAKNRYLLSFDDGVTWHSGLCTGLPATQGSFYGASAYINGMHHLWMTGNLYVSANGINWTLRGSITNDPGIGNYYGDLGTPFFRNGYYYCNTGSQIYRSTNGFSWSAWGVAAPGSGSSGSIGYVGGNWIAPTSTTSLATIYTSSDPTTSWTLRYTSSFAAVYGGQAVGINQHGPN